MTAQTRRKTKSTDRHPQRTYSKPRRETVENQRAANNARFSPFGFWLDAFEYQRDAWERGVLFWDTLRKRANNMLDHEAEGMPPPLAFKYETVLDARTFERPSNYALLKILETDEACLEDCLDLNKPPVIVVDPRAGHGPGIGGFKRESEVGIAMHEGYPVYFVMFYPDPEAHQTIADILNSMRIFVEEVAARHKGKKPILYGNCQAGWLITLLSAHCGGVQPGLTVMNGSPLSYWAGSKQRNPMQVLGGLSGGVWLARLASDVNGGVFDGAWLVQNFENLTPAQAIWKKYIDLYENIDREQERFLEFERWWNGYYRFSEEEITATVENLFIGDKLEHGEFQLQDDCTIDLKEIKCPIFIFASEGDSITPPRQALHWIRTVYPDTNALKKAGQRIVYMINPHVGHLGIFVSAKVARLEHRAILEQALHTESLEPGLYEMIIRNPTGDPDCRHDQYMVSFEERQLDDLCEIASQAPFQKVRQISEQNDVIYSAIVQPWIKALTTFAGPGAMTAYHPLRLRRLAFSDRANAAMLPLAFVANAVHKNRHSSQHENPFLRAERQLTGFAVDAAEAATVLRDRLSEGVFDTLFDRKES